MLAGNLNASRCSFRKPLWWFECGPILSQHIPFISWEFCKELTCTQKKTWPKYLANKYANVYFGETGLWPILWMQEADSLQAAHNNFNGSPIGNPITTLMGEKMIWYDVLHNKMAGWGWWLYTHLAIKVTMWANIYTWLTFLKHVDNIVEQSGQSIIIRPKKLGQDKLVSLINMLAIFSRWPKL